MKKIAIIATGGGMLCAFSAGCFAALQKEFQYTKPAIIIAGSGSAGNAYYYLSNQCDALKRIWLKHLASNRFILWWRLDKIMDIDYLIDTVFTKFEPFNNEAFKASSTAVYVPLLSLRTNQLQYIGNGSALPPLEILRASKSMPVLYGKKVRLGDSEYKDGATLANIQDMTQFASNLGATHFLVLDNKNSHPFYVFLKGLFYSNQLKTYSVNLTPENSITLKYKSSSLAMVTRNPATLESIFDEGYATTLNYPALKEFLAS